MCMTCRKLHHHTMEQMILPPRDKSPPFTCSSVDTFGPYFFNGRNIHEVYGYIDELCT